MGQAFDAAKRMDSSSSCSLEVFSNSEFQLGTETFPSPHSGKVARMIMTDDTAILATPYRYLTYRRHQKPRGGSPQRHTLGRDQDHPIRYRCDYKDIEEGA